MRNYAKQEMLELLRADYPTASFAAEEAAPPVYVAAEELCPLLQRVKLAGFNRLENVTAVDYKEYYELVYHLFNWQENSWLTVKLKVAHEQPEAPSVTEVFPGADFEEREIYDLLGIRLNGHPNLRRILLADDFVGHPLRKDYRQLEPPAVRRDLGAKHA